ncbi:MAG TPA: hypothetical protein VG204_22430 [Terriglobia bacterium]|nr:hypothetical protein [Terriglobia bacterium]
MRLLLDSNSLIDLVEHGRPVDVSAFAAKLRSVEAKVVLTLTNVREFSAPAFLRQDFLSHRALLQEVERLPLAYMCEVSITWRELLRAWIDFSAGHDYTPTSPYVSQWIETLYLYGAPRNATPLVNVRLDDSVYELRASWEQRFEERRSVGTIIRQQFAADRKLPPARGDARRRNFVRTVEGNLGVFGIDIPKSQIEPLGNWIYENPERCPGLRLIYETRDSLLHNLTDEPQDNDLWDFIHLQAIPYVDAICLDRRAADYAHRAARLIRGLNPSVDYADRIFSNLREVISAKFS